MKTTIVKITIAAICLITIGSQIATSSYLARKAEQRNIAASQSRPLIPASSYNEVLGGLFTASWR